MLTVLTANSQAGGFTIANSLRFRSSASAYLSRTPASASNRTTWTWSGWVKRGVFGQQQLFSADRSAGSEGAGIQFTSSSQIQCYAWNGSSFDYNLISSQVFRDPSAWYHIDLLFDTTQATSSNRIKIYVNGVQITAFDTSTYPAQNLSGYINSAQLHTLGRASYYSGLYFDGYLAEINFIDGQALTPSSFGEIDSTTGVWKARRYTGTYGTNGFRLNFSNGTSTTTLGYDSSGNGNNWTTNNISLTAGSTYDWMLDSPTPFAGTSYGVGNYAVLNPLVRLNTNTAMTFSQANLVCVGNSVWSPTVSTIQYPSTGKWYWEAIFNGTAYSPSGPTSNYSFVGVSNTSNTTSYGIDTTSALILGDTGYGNNFASANTLQYGSSIQSGAIVGIAIDRDANTFTFYVNNSSVWTGTINYTSGATLAPFVANYNGSYTTLAINFGQRPFAYTPPSGYKSLCTQNLPGVTIQNGAQYMAATTYTGTGATQTLSNAVNGVSFQPDLVWIKVRNSTQNHCLFDSIRGVGIALNSNATAAEYNSAPSLTAFSSNGFNLGADTNTAEVNVSTKTYVGWQWKAGGTAVTNTAGSITSSVSANPTAGFSVVTYTGNGVSTATVGHGLGITPSMIIIKIRSSSAYGWPVMHSSLPTNGNVFLNSTQAYQTTYGQGGIANPASSTTFGFVAGSSGGGQVYDSGSTYVAYCFAAIPGYSAFGSYTGNGSADGAFIYTGFLPKLILVKCSSSTGNWFMLDTARNTYNVIGEQLEPNLSNAGSTVTTLDVLSNGFKMRTSSDPNASQTYVYAAFAANPFKNSLAF